MRSIEPGTHNPDCPKVRSQREANVFMGPGLRFASGNGWWVEALGLAAYVSASVRNRLSFPA
jgi:hypothetical protein